MDIQQLIGFDQELLLKLNGSDSLFWDGFMWIATSTSTWQKIGSKLTPFCLRLIDNDTHGRIVECIKDTCNQNKSTCVGRRYANRIGKKDESKG